MRDALTMLTPPPRRTVSEWADQERVLVSESSAEPGDWHTDRASYQREPMDCVNDPRVEQITCMWAAQCGKSEIILNAMGSTVVDNPRPMLMIQPTVEMGEAFSKDRIEPMLRSCPSLSALVGDHKSRDSGQTIRHKKFPGGRLTITGANSPAGLAMRPVPVIFFDEIDRAPLSAGKEGDPFTLARQRARNFPNRKFIVTATPTDDGISRIQQEFLASDQRYFMVPCPHCGEFQRLAWARVVREDDDWNKAHYECEKCGGWITDADKPKMLKAGHWEATQPFNGNAGFHLSALYSPWVTFAEVGREHKKAKRSPETLKVWVNTTLGETWKNLVSSVGWRSIYDRREQYAAEAPEGVLFVTAGEDTQDDRLEVSFWGWGVDEEGWLLDHVVLRGDPEKDDLWARLDDQLRRTFADAEGNKYPVYSAMLDSGGHHTQRVYRFCRDKKLRRIYATKGIGGEGKPIVMAPSRKRTGRGRRAVDLYMIGDDGAKTAVYSRLKIADAGPGHLHFPINDRIQEDYFKGLVAERLVEEIRAGVTRKVWKLPSGKRNEPLDCAKLALAAMMAVNPNWERLAMRAKSAGERDQAADQQPRRPRRSPLGSGRPLGLGVGRLGRR